jgi:hypothetical protein
MCHRQMLRFGIMSNKEKKRSDHQGIPRNQPGAMWSVEITAHDVEHDLIQYGNMNLGLAAAPGPSGCHGLCVHPGKRSPRSVRVTADCRAELYPPPATPTLINSLAPSLTR